MQDTQAVEVEANGLDLEGYCSTSAGVPVRDCLYDLVSVCNHSGVLDGGHYTANCRVTSAPSGDLWLDFNDTRVRSAPFPSQPPDPDEVHHTAEPATATSSGWTSTTREGGGFIALHHASSSVRNTI